MKGAKDYPPTISTSVKFDFTMISGQKLNAFTSEFSESSAPAASTQRKKSLSLTNS